MGMESTNNQAAVDRLEREMPSLNHLEGSLRGKRDLGKLLGVHAQPSGRGQQIADGYVRLVEKAVLEYQEARTKHITFIAEGLADDFYRAQDHFESCIHSLHRAILYLERLRSLGYRRADGEPFIPRPRDLEVLRTHVRAKVRDMRDAAEHLDNDILDGKLLEDATVGIHLGWDKASLGELQLSFTDVARWIEQLHELGAAVIYVVFAAGLLKGRLFPEFHCLATAGDCNDFVAFVRNWSPKGATEYGKAIVWGFIAGFSERFVPDILNRLGSKTAE